MATDVLFAVRCACIVVFGVSVVGLFVVIFMCGGGRVVRLCVLQTYIFIVHFFKDNFLYLPIVISSFTST